MDTLKKLSLSFDCQVFVRNPGEEWQVLDLAPGIFSFSEGQEAGIRIQNIDDQILGRLLIEIDGHPRLKMLNLSENRKITDRGLGLLQQVPGLTALNLSSCDLTDAGLPQLAALRYLEWLNLSYCNRITYIGLKPLVKLNYLKYLDLQGCVNVKSGEIPRLKFKNVQIHK